MSAAVVSTMMTRTLIDLRSINTESKQNMGCTGTTRRVLGRIWR